MPVVAPPISDPRRTRMLSGVADATVDVRKACNGIKRTAALGAAAMVMGMDPRKVAAASESMAFDVLKSIGFDVANEDRLASVMPMMLEATATVLADAAYHAEQGNLSPDALVQAAKFGVGVLGEVARSRAVSKMVEPGYPSDMDSIVALRLTAASAMAHVAIEIADFDFAHTPAECIREAGKAVVKAAMDATAKIAPVQASAGSRLMLTQSLIQSGSKVYAAAWRVTAQGEACRLDTLPESAREESLLSMESASLPQLLEGVNKRFSHAFSAITETAIEIFDERPTSTPATNVNRKPARPR